MLPILLLWERKQARPSFKAAAYFYRPSLAAISFKPLLSASS